MRPRRLLLLLLTLAAGFALCLGVHPKKDEPVFEGKPLDHWLDNGFEDATRAVHEIGPSAAACIFDKLKREHPRYGRWSRYRAVWRRLPGFCQKFLPAPRMGNFDEWRASQMLLAIGPAVIPVLGQALGERDYLVRSTAAQTLVHFGERGTRISAASTALLRASGDSDVDVRNLARKALSLMDGGNSRTAAVF